MLIIGSALILTSLASLAHAAEIVAILRNTPWWVYPVLGLLVVLGLQATRPRTVSLLRVLIIPAVFIGWGALNLASQITVQPLLAAAWLASAAGGGTLALLTTRLGDLVVDRRRGLVRLRGSRLPLARNLAIFATKYGLAVAAAIAPLARNGFAFWDTGVSGAAAGYFLGWLACFAVVYRSAPSAELAGAAQPRG